MSISMPLTRGYGGPMFSRIAAAVLALGLATSLTSAASAASATSATDATRSKAVAVTVLGRGYGHGHGLSQYGAQGAALKGKTHRQILGFYYPGLAVGRSAGDVSVLISADRTSDVMVGARTGLIVKQVTGSKTVKLAAAKPRAQRWRITPVSGNSRIDYFQRGWRRLTTLKGDAEFSAGGQPITLFVTNKTKVAYRGVLRSSRGDTVNILPLDSYVQGVVPLEVFPSWKPEALESQAVAARTYAAFERRQPLAPHYEICDTTQCQVYGGYSAETPTTNAAVRATAKQVLTKGGLPAFTQFSASNGGWTSAGGFPYLPEKKDPYDTFSGNPYNTWTATIKAAAIEKALPAIGTLVSVEVTKRDSHGIRATEVEITGTDTSTEISGDDFRSWFGLRSTYFAIG
jgi:stage II sporulation protein D